MSFGNIFWDVILGWKLCKQTSYSRPKLFFFFSFKNHNKFSSQNNVPKYRTKRTWTSLWKRSFENGLTLHIPTHKYSIVPIMGLVLIKPPGLKFSQKVSFKWPGLSRVLRASVHQNQGFPVFFKKAFNKLNLKS